MEEQSKNEPEFVTMAELEEIGCQFCDEKSNAFLSLQEKDHPGLFMFCSWFCLSAYGMKMAKQQTDRDAKEREDEVKKAERRGERRHHQCLHCGQYS